MGRKKAFHHREHRAHGEVLNCHVRTIHDHALNVRKAFLRGLCALCGESFFGRVKQK